VRSPGGAKVGKTEESLEENRALFEVDLYPGGTYRRALISAVALATLVAIAAVLPVGPADTTAKFGLIAFFGFGFIGGLLWLASARQARRLVITRTHVCLLSSARTLRVIPWARVAQIQYGSVPVLSAARSPSYLVIYPKRGRALRIVEGLGYRVAPGAIRTAALRLADLARSFTIPVIERDTIRF